MKSQGSVSTLNANLWVEIYKDVNVENVELKGVCSLASVNPFLFGIPNISQIRGVKITFSQNTPKGHTNEENGLKNDMQEILR